MVAELYGGFHTVFTTETAITTSVTSIEFDLNTDYDLTNTKQLWIRGYSTLNSGNINDIVFPVAMIWNHSTNASTDITSTMGYTNNDGSSAVAGNLYVRATDYNVLSVQNYSSSAGFTITAIRLLK